MQKRRRVLCRWGLPAFLVLFIGICRCCPPVAEWYARHIYPSLSALLSGAASIFPFSLEEIVVVGAGLVLLLYPFHARRRQKRKLLPIAGRELEIVLWMYVWFYMGWGINYFRSPFFARARIQPSGYEETAFRSFLAAYTDSLNRAYLPDKTVRLTDMEAEIKALYRQVPAEYGLCRPQSYQHPKRVLFNPLYSGVGVLGYMGPFFAESQLNAELLPIQQPFTYAHELSHLLGVGSEAEANFWAYQVCTHAASAYIRYSGHFGLLPYVLANARRALPEADYRAWVHSIRPEVLAQFNAGQAYWAQRYSPLVGRVQDRVYDWFLKGNQIPAGKQNYAEVINMIITWNSNSKQLFPTKLPN